MTDIVETLRFLGTGEPVRGPCMIEAADEIETLRKRVAELETVVLAEREACAAICDAYGMPDGTSPTAETLAKAIRARGEK